MTGLDVAEIQMWARMSGAIARYYFNHTQVWNKTDNSLVTQADLEIERFLRERITARYPDHGILGEEQGSDHTEREFVWVVDPLDGTAAFVSGLPIWGISIGILHRGKPYAGLFYMPVTEEYFWAETGKGAFLNGHPIRVQAGQQINGNDWLATPSKAHLNYAISFPGKTRSLGSVASYFCYVARGSAIGALLGRPKLWDIAAGLCILQEAGGVALGLSGKAIDLTSMLAGQSSSEPMLLGNPEIMPQLLASIQPKRRL